MGNVVKTEKVSGYRLLNATIWVLFMWAFNVFPQFSRFVLTPSIEP